MTIKRLLLYLHDLEDKVIFNPTVQICKDFSSQLFVLYVLEESRVAHIARLTRDKHDSIRQRLEEEGWEMLYLMEDEAVSGSVRTSLHLEEGSPVAVMKKFVDHYEIDALVVKRRDETKKLFIGSPIPVIGL